MNDRLGTAVEVVRADRLMLGMSVLVGSWDGSVSVQTVRCLELVGDDVHVRFVGDECVMTTSVGNCFHVVSGE